MILGSAIASLESLHNAAIGRYRHLRLPARVGCVTGPTVKVIDLRRAMARGPLSAALIARITEARVLRIDRDAVRGHAAWEQVLARIAEGRLSTSPQAPVPSQARYHPQIALKSPKKYE